MMESDTVVSAIGHSSFDDPDHPAASKVPRPKRVMGTSKWHRVNAPLDTSPSLWKMACLASQKMTKPQGVGLRTASNLPRAKAGGRNAFVHREDPSIIAVVDDDPGVLRCIARLLAVHRFDVRAYSSAEVLLSEIASVGPNCVITDLSMPGLSGLDLQRKLGESNPAYPIIFVTAHGDIRTSVLAMRCGAVDFLTKPFDQSDLLEAVDRAIARGIQLRLQTERLAHARQKVNSLTEREREVYQQVVAGLLNKQIAASLGIAEKTVKVHRARIMRKMDMRSVAQLARVAEQLDSACNISRII